MDIYIYIDVKVSRLIYRKICKEINRWMNNQINEELDIRQKDK